MAKADIIIWGLHDLSQAQFARAIGVWPIRISHVVKGTRPVTAELALLFWRVLGQPPQIGSIFRPPMI